MLDTREYFRKQVAGNNLFVGIDVHKESWAVCIVDSRGECIKKFNQGASPQQLLKTLEKPLKDGLNVHCTYEAGYFGFEPARILIQGGCICTVSAPSLIPVLVGSRIKTDSIDSRKLATCLAAHMLTKVWIPSRQLEIDRELARHRTQIQKDRVRLMVRLRSRLSQYGLQAPAGTNWTMNFMKEFAAVTENAGGLHFIQKSDLHHLEYLNTKIKSLDREIKALADRPEYAKAAKRIRTMPGVGPLTVMKVILEIGDFARFFKKGRIEAYCGLTPSQHSSGEKVRMGHITKSGRSSLRSTLIEAAWLLVKNDPGYHQLYLELKFRRGAKRAIVAVARRMIGTMRRLVLDDQDYKPRELAA
jgi:transposase